MSTGGEVPAPGTAFNPLAPPPRVEHYRVGGHRRTLTPGFFLRRAQRLWAPGQPRSRSAAPAGGGMGTTLGVFVPVCVSIWSVILFLRLSWIVGQAGVGGAAGVVLLSVLVTAITASSLSAICTNGDIGPGGVYYIVSRVLGPGWGVSSGVLFWLCQAMVRGRPGAL